LEAIGKAAFYAQILAITLAKMRPLINILRISNVLM
jgi:hypothetical protein